MTQESLNHPLQSIMSRTGSFPLRVAYNLIKKYCNQSCVIFDPFCGKGTTLLAARLLGHSAYGMDIAPEAVICSRAKLVNVNSHELEQYIDNLKTSYPFHDRIPISVKTFFHPFTLAQILSIKSKLLEDIESNNSKKRANAIFTLATLLGILHGHSSFSLSVPSAHSYSMAPLYVARYAAKHLLRPPKRDAKKCLKAQVSRCLGSPLPSIRDFDVQQGTVFQCTKVFPDLINRVDLILTSPPYLNAQTYAKDNWLRLWLLGYDYKTLKPGYIETGSITRYAEYMEKAFLQLNLLLRPGGLLICIAGDVKLRTSRTPFVTDGYFATAKFLGHLCSSKNIGLKIIHYEKHIIPSNRRYFHSLSNSNGHSKNRLVERIFVAKKI